MNTPRRSALADRRVQLPKVADVVAARIRELIVTGELADGERLPRLEVLLDDFGVSGPSMREALRMLESERLITVQRGSVGGAVVHRPDAGTAAYTMALVMRSRGTELGHVFEAMTLLEPICAMLCARRADRMKTVVKEMKRINSAARKLLDGDDVRWNETMTSFHKAVVQGSGNEALTLVVGVLESVLLVNVRAWAETSAAHGTYPSRVAKLKNIECHEEICELIAAGKDLEVASKMTDHIDGYLQIIYQTKGIDPTQRVNVDEVGSSHR